jgi:hypothetical protein
LINCSKVRACQDFRMTENPCNSEHPERIVLDYLPRRVNGLPARAGGSWLPLISTISALLAMLAMIAVMFAFEMLMLLGMEYLTEGKLEPVAPSALAASCAAAILLCWLASKSWQKQRRMERVMLDSDSRTADTTTNAPAACTPTTQ